MVALTGIEPAGSQFSSVQLGLSSCVFGLVQLIERWHRSLKGECIRPGTPLSLDDARRLVKGYVEHHNNVRLNSAIGYIAPKDMLSGHQQEIQSERDRKLEAAR